MTQEQMINVPINSPEGGSAIGFVTPDESSVLTETFDLMRIFESRTTVGVQQPVCL